MREFNKPSRDHKQNQTSAISIIVSGPFCMIIGLVAAGYWSNNNPYAIVTGMVIGFVFGAFMRKKIEEGQGLP